jgi:hypothetical protein
MVSREAPGPGSGGFGRGGDSGVRESTSGAGDLVEPRFAVVRGAALIAARLLDAGAGRALATRPAARPLPDARLEELTPELPDPAHRVRDRPEGHHRSCAR